ncbi:MAG: DUF2007 domain-containing protein [Tannerella sp.]|jgi:hypothetical protein|nr:DUF2007 domain-containing protein [Tannerella sp.]
MDRIVEIANFQQPERAALLADLLKAEGIECYVRNEVCSRVLRGYIDTGAQVDVLESDVPQALEIMRNAGYVLPDQEPETASEHENTGLACRIPFLRHFSFEKQLIIIIGLLIGLAAFIIYLQSYLSAEKLN